MDRADYVEAYQRKARDKAEKRKHDDFIAALVASWRKGECALVKETIANADTPGIGDMWQRQILAQLMATERPYFLQYMR